MWQLWIHSSVAALSVHPWSFHSYTLTWTLEESSSMQSGVNPCNSSLLSSIVGRPYLQPPFSLEISPLPPDDTVAQRKRKVYSEALSLIKYLIGLIVQMQRDQWASLARGEAKKSIAGSWCSGISYVAGPKRYSASCSSTSFLPTACCWACNCDPTDL